jgi:hypothetical protein
MAVSETDLEILEQYLDGCIKGDDAQMLGRRLATETAFSAALQEVRAQRMVRQALWNSLDPDQTAADRLSWRIRGAVLDQEQNAARQRWSWSPWRIASIGSSAAACVVLGFLIGRIGRSGTGTPVEQPTALVSARVSGEGLGGTNSPGDASLTSLQQPSSSNPFHRTNGVPQVMVPITNEYGQVVAWQRFDDADQAKNFEEDLHRTHVQPTGPATAGQPRLASQTEVHF